MTTWNSYHKTINKLKVTDKISKTIIKELGDATEGFFLFDTKVRPQRTRLINDKLALLGHNKFKYKIYANGLSLI